MAGAGGAVPPARDTPSPKSRPAQPGASQHLPANQALPKNTDATRVPAGDALCTTTLCSLGRQQSAQRPLRSARPAAAAAAGDCRRSPARRSALVVSGKLRGWPR